VAERRVASNPEAENVWASGRGDKAGESGRIFFPPAETSKDGTGGGERDGGRKGTSAAAEVRWVAGVHGATGI
jgi:hypothetical protein